MHTKIIKMLDELKHITLPWIGKTAKMLDYCHTQKLKEHGFDLTKEQWILLKVLSNHPDVTQNKLACLTNRDKTSMTRLIHTLEKKGLIARISARNDKRINQLQLTPKGLQMLNKAEQIFMQLVIQLQHGLSEQEIENLINVLKKIQDNIEYTRRYNPDNRK